MKAASRDRATSIGCGALLAAVGVGIALLAAAMRLYPGGNAIEAHQPGHSFWLNFLCDLTSGAARNGVANPLGGALARAAMVAFAAALGIFWLILPALFPARRALAAALRIAGSISTLGFALVPIATHQLHVVAVFASSVPGVLAAALGLVGMIRHTRRRALVVVALAAIVAGVVDAVLYAQSYAISPRVVPPALPAWQRIALLAMLVWMVGTALAVSRRPPSAQVVP